ncbi:MAG: alpha/beta hydrolase, partial [Bacilli bacterium]|nr:alpha/beta hydrolase [Bacilli bacterium]
MILKGKKISIYYETYGNKKNTIVILPGWGDTRKTFQFFIDSLKEDYKIYILDYPGFGNSITPKNTLTLEDYVELIQEWFQKENIKNPIIIAHSFGGRISSLLISKYKIKVKKLLLIDVAGIKRRKKLKIFLKEKIYKLLKHLIKLLPKNIQKKQLIKL